MATVRLFMTSKLLNLNCQFAVRILDLTINSARYQADGSVVRYNEFK